jgi:type I restriction enzyme S subunit
VSITVSLGEVCEVLGGATPSKRNASYFKGSIPWATIRDMRGDMIETTECLITEQALASCSSSLIPAGKVVIATRVGLGKVCRVGQPTAINQDIRGLVPKDPSILDDKYLFYCMKAKSQTIVAAGAGATVQGVRLDFIKALEIPLPSLEEQRRIVKVLDEATTSISALKQNRLAKLDAVVKLKASASRQIGMQPLAGMGGGVHSEATLGDLAVIRTGKIDVNAATEDGAFPFFTCARQIYRINDAPYEGHAVIVAGNGDLNVKYYEGRFNAYQRTYFILSHDEERLFPRYLYHFMDGYLETLRNSAIGSTIKYIKMGDLTNIRIPLVPVAEQRSIASLLDEVAEIENHAAAICEETLEEIRTLQTALMTKMLVGV